MGRYKMHKQKFDELPELLTTTQVMWALNVSKRGVYLLMQEGQLRATNIASPDKKRVRYRFFKEDTAKLRDRIVTFDYRDIVKPVKRRRRK